MTCPGSSPLYCKKQYLPDKNEIGSLVLESTCYRIKSFASQSLVMTSLVSYDYLAASINKRNREDKNS